MSVFHRILGKSGDQVEAGLQNFNLGASLHTLDKPLPYGALGHYRQIVRFSMAISQNANSRLWEVRNASPSALIIPTRLRVIILPVGTVTASYRMEVDLFKLTGFTAVDTTGTVTPGTPSNKRTATMAATPGAIIRHVTVAGAAGGMTGGTLTKDATASAIAEAWAATAAANTLPSISELLDDVNGTHPHVLGQNEGLELENIVAGSATANSVDVAVDFSWAEVTAF